MNIILGVITIFITFSLLVLVEKLFKKEGLYVWVAISTITANILVCKSSDFLGLTTSLGNVLFSSNFLATDIMCEKYGSKHSKKAIILGVTAQIIFIIATQLGLAYIPSSTDISHEAMETLFSLNLRTSTASIVMYLATNMFDIYLFEKIKKKFPNQLWLRNNVATIISNCSENYLFFIFAFLGIFDFKIILEMATVGAVIEMVIALLDTPFLYLAKSKILDGERVEKSETVEEQYQEV